MDPLMILTLFVSTVTIIGFVYGLLQRFKMEDIDDHVCRLETRMDKLEERMFWLATDKKLEDEILEERIKSSKNV